MLSGGIQATTSIFFTFANLLIKSFDPKALLIIEKLMSGTINAEQQKNVEKYKNPYQEYLEYKMKKITGVILFTFIGFLEAHAGSAGFSISASRVGISTQSNGLVTFFISNTTLTELSGVDLTGCNDEGSGQMYFDPSSQSNVGIMAATVLTSRAINEGIGIFYSDDPTTIVSTGSAGQPCLIRAVQALSR